MNLRTATKISILMLALLLVGKQCGASSLETARDFEPWEAGALANPENPFGPISVGPQSLLSSASTGLIRLYQRRISTNSVGRCPFVISCSNFALQTIKRHGFIVGMCLFLDRNFYRENPQIGYLYPYRQQKLGLLRLDDSFFLDPR